MTIIQAMMNRQSQTGDKKRGGLVPNRPEDVLKVDADEDGVGGDDSADALRIC